MKTKRGCSNIVCCPIFGCNSDHKYDNHPKSDIQAVPMQISNFKPQYQHSNNAQVIFCFHPNFSGVCTMEFDSTVPRGLLLCQNILGKYGFRATTREYSCFSTTIISYHNHVCLETINSPNVPEPHSRHTKQYK